MSSYDFDRMNKDIAVLRKEILAGRYDLYPQLKKLEKARSMARAEVARAALSSARKNMANAAGTVTKAVKHAARQENRVKARVYVSIGTDAVTTTTAKSVKAIASAITALRKKEEDVAKTSFTTQDVTEEASKLDALTDEERAHLNALLGKANG